MRFSNLWIVKNNSSICIVLGKDYKFNENWKWPYYLLDKRMVKGCERDMIMQHECVMKNGNDQVLECMQVEFMVAICVKIQFIWIGCVHHNYGSKISFMTRFHIL